MKAKCETNCRRRGQFKGAAGRSRNPHLPRSFGSEWGSYASRGGGKALQSEEKNTRRKDLIVLAPLRDNLIFNGEEEKFTTRDIIKKKAER